MSQSKTFYHFEITTTERIMHVFGTVMLRSEEGVLVDLWCPEEPCLTQGVIVAHQDIGGAIENLLQECMEKSFVSEKPYTIRVLSN